MFFFPQECCSRLISFEKLTQSCKNNDLKLEATFRWRNVIRCFRIYFWEEKTNSFVETTWSVCKKIWHFLIPLVRTQPPRVLLDFIFALLRFKLPAEIHADPRLGEKSTLIFLNPQGLYMMFTTSFVTSTAHTSPPSTCMHCKALQFFHFWWIWF